MAEEGTYLVGRLDGPAISNGIGEGSANLNHICEATKSVSFRRVAKVHWGKPTGTALLQGQEDSGRVFGFGEASCDESH